VEARRWREEKERPLAMIWEKCGKRGRKGKERIPGKREGCGEVAMRNV
jgi:hypothetical protein